MSLFTDNVLLDKIVGYLQQGNLFSQDKGCLYRKMMLSLINPQTCKMVEVDSIYLMIELMNKGEGRSVLPKRFFLEKQD
ncbi:hypothetical protein BCR22_05090 [Enterococcus plantarum]|nr:hypothetical protein BCR22_05090 [Enterococcus plantarum]